MSFFFNDQFTGPAGLLTAHTSDSGHVWIAAPNMYTFADARTNHFSINGSGLCGQDVPDPGDNNPVNGGYGQAARAVVTPPSADYEVEFVARADATNSQGLAVAGRYDEASGDGYTVSAFPVDATTIHLDLFTVGLGTFLYSPEWTVADATNYKIKLSMVGTTIKLYVDDVLVVTATNSEISAAGTIGIYLFPSTAGSFDQIAFDYITATDLGAPTAFWTAKTGAVEVDA